MNGTLLRNMKSRAVISFVYGLDGTDRQCNKWAEQICKALNEFHNQGEDTEYRFIIKFFNEI